MILGEVTPRFGSIRLAVSMDFATLLREARTSCGLTQSQVGERAGCSLHAVWEAEHGHGTVALLYRLLTALDVRLAGLPRGSTLAERVFELRQRRGWSRERLAQRAGVSLSSIERLERGNARIATLSAVLAVLAPAARARKPELARWGGGSRDERFTPADMLDRIASVLNGMDLDPCAHPDSPVTADRYLYKTDDGLSQSWSAGTAYVNPPYSLTSNFIRRAQRAWVTGECQTVLMLIPVQTQHQVFHEAIVGSADVLFLRGKIAFERPGLPRAPAPFGNLLALFGGDEAMLERLLTTFEGVHLPRGARVASFGQQG